MFDFIVNMIKKDRDDRTLVICRGVPGSGKSSFAREMAGDYPVFEADSYFMIDGKYVFDRNKLGAAHRQCQNSVESSMQSNVKKIFVSNTSTQQKELKPYYELAEKYGYKVYSVVVENRHGGKDVHGVPEEALARMENNIKNSLKLR